MTAGGESQVVFTTEPATEPIVAEPKPVTTELTLSVPAEAKVTLAGNVTSQTGEKRKFATTRLTAGQVWDNYTIRVEFERDGNTVTQERTITLTGGESHEIAFSADGPLLAAR